MELEGIEKIVKKYAEALDKIEEIEANTYSQQAVEKLKSIEVDLIDAMIDELEDEAVSLDAKIEEEELCDCCVCHIVKNGERIHIYWDDQGLGLAIEKAGEVIDSYYV